MAKQFGDDAATMKIISKAIKTKMTESKEQLKPADIDQIENEIFKKLSNTNREIALDAFHPRLIANPNLKRSELNTRSRSPQSIFAQDVLRN